MADMGITTFAADASRQPKQYTITGTSGSNSVTAYSAPRYPTNIYYNASTWDEELNEYNTLYVAQGVSIDSPGNPNETGRCVDTSSTTCLTTPASEADVLASESRIELGHVLNNDPRVTFAHQSNLTFPDYTLLSLLSDVLAQYNSWYSTATPYVQTTDVSSSQILSEQAAWATAEAANTVSAVASDGTETVTNGGKSAIAVPITAPTGSTALGEAFGSPYGDSLSAWETLAPGASVTIGVPGIPQTITFSTPPTDAVVNGTPSAISATGGGSGNPVVLSVDALSTAICSLADGAVSYLSIGTCVIDATQAGNLYYASATSSESFPVGGIPQTITFSTPPTDAVVNGTPDAISASGGGSGIPVVLSVDASSTAICSLADGAVSYLSIGTCVIDATEAGTSSYAPATSSESFPVVGIPQTITFSTPPTNAVVNGTPSAISATGGGSGNPVVLSVDALSTAICSLADGAVSYLSIGTCVIDATQAGNLYHVSATSSESFPVGGIPQTITFSTPPTDAVVNGTPDAISASVGGSGIPVVLSVDASSTAICSLADGAVSYLSIGTCVIDATEAGTSSYAPATSSESFPVVGIPQTITFSTPPTNAVVNGTPSAISASGGGSGNPVVLSVDASSTAICSLADGAVSYLSIGTCVIDATQAGNLYYASATSSESFPVGGIPQTITFSTPPTDAVVNGTPDAISASGGGSGIPVVLSVDASSTAICSLADGAVSYLSIGTCVIDATQAGTSSYAPATSSESFPVVGIPQTITFTSSAPTNAVVDGTPYEVTATGGNSGNPVTFSVDALSAGACSVFGETVSFLSTGTCFIDASEAGTSSYASATATQSFPVVGRVQKISFTSIAPTNAFVGGPIYHVAATGGGSGNPVIFSVDTSSGGACSLLGTAVSFHAMGSCVIDASQAGNSSYAAAVATQSFRVLEPTTTRISLAPTGTTYGHESTAVFSVSVTYRSGVAVPNGETVTVHVGTVKCTAVLKAGKGTCKISNSALPVGTYAVSAAYGGDTNLSASDGSAASKLTVKTDKTAVKVTLSPAIVTYGRESASVFTARFTTRYGEVAPKGEKVTVHVGSARCTVALRAGNQTCKIADFALPVGSYSVWASYSGDGNLSGSKGSSTSKLTVTSHSAI